MRELHYRWMWNLESSPGALWERVSDTDRFNRDTHLPAVRAAGGEQRRGRRRLRLARLGLRLEWDEEPFEWVRPEAFSVRRNYVHGPLRSLRVQVKLQPRKGGGTRLVYETWVRPRGPLGWLGVPPVLGIVQKRDFERVFRGYDREAAGGGSEAGTGRTAEFVPGGRERLGALRSELGGKVASPALAARLVRLIESADPAELAKLRPSALAREWGCDRRELLELCLEATRAGMLDLRWDVLCPRCRGSKQSASHLAEVDLEFRCDACEITARADFERLVEVTFRPAAAICAVDDAIYCVGGPQLTPHVVAQQLLDAGETRSLELTLDPGSYRVRSPGLTGELQLHTSEEGRERVRIELAGQLEGEIEVASRATVDIANRESEQQLVVIEQTAWSDEATTAAEVIALQRFRDLFAQESLRPGEQVSVGNLTVVFTDLRESTRMYRALGDAPAFGLVMEHFGVLRGAIADEGGSIVKTIGDAVMAVFPRPSCAVRAMLAAQVAFAEPQANGHRLTLKVGIHHGPCIAVTLNGQLDYFGSVVNMAARLAHLSAGDDMVLSEGVWDDAEVAAALRDCGRAAGAEAFRAELRGFEHQPRVWRVGNKSEE